MLRRKQQAGTLQAPKLLRRLMAVFLASFSMHVQTQLHDTQRAHNKRSINED